MKDVEREQLRNRDSGAKRLCPWSAGECPLVSSDSDGLCGSRRVAPLASRARGSTTSGTPARRSQSAAGADVKVLQRMLGHASATMTLDRYGHLMAGQAEAVADRLDELAETASRSTAKVIRLDSAAG